MKDEAGNTISVIADVDAGTLAEADISWSIVDEDGLPSSAADLYIVDGYKVAIVGKDGGNAYVMARFANGTSVMDKIEITAEKAKQEANTEELEKHLKIQRH